MNVYPHPIVVNGTISFPIEVDLRNYKFCLAAIHSLIKARRRRIRLDFSACAKATPSAMIGIISQLKPEVTFEYVPPKDKKLAQVFRKNCWEFYIKREPFDVTSKSSVGSTTLLHVTNAANVHDTVDQVILTVLSGISGISRSELQALEWSLNEVLDNVFNHGQSPNGAYVEATVFKKKRVVDFVVSDNGRGIPESMKRIGIHDPVVALNQAIKEGVTSNKGYNKGNGLYGTSQIAIKSRGHFLIDSGNARIFYDRTQDSVSAKSDKIPYSGCLVHWSVGLGDRDLLRKALVFEGKAHEIYFDLIDKRFAQDDDWYRVFVRDYPADISTRTGGERFRTLIENLASDEEGEGVIVSFADVSIVTSSFADEVFAKLAEKFGADWLRRRIRVERANDTIQGVISREIASRLREA